MFTVDAILSQYYPRLAGRPLITPPIRSVLREAQFISFAEQYPHLQGYGFWLNRSWKPCNSSTLFPIKTG